MLSIIYWGFNYLYIESLGFFMWVKFFLFFNFYGIFFLVLGSYGRLVLVIEEYLLWFWVDYMILWSFVFFFYYWGWGGVGGNYFWMVKSFILDDILKEFNIVFGFLCYLFIDLGRKIRFFVFLTILVFLSYIILNLKKEFFFLRCGL